jgi:hypothetical protein
VVFLDTEHSSRFMLYVYCYFLTIIWFLSVSIIFTLRLQKSKQHLMVPGQIVALQNHPVNIASIFCITHLNLNTLLTGITGSTIKILYHFRRLSCLYCINWWHILSINLWLVFNGIQVKLLPLLTKSIGDNFVKFWYTL